MKIAIYKDTFANNRGADVAVRDLAAGLQERGHSVTLFDKSGFAANVHGDYDVIVSAGTNEILDLAEENPLPPIVQQFHTDPVYPFRHRVRRWRRNRAIKAALKKASSYQVLSQVHADTLCGILGASVRNRISVIGNWSRFEDAATGESLREERVILCPGAINKDKNQVLLVKSFAAVADEFPGWRIHVYGSGRERIMKSLRRKIESCGLSERIVLKGYSDLAGPYSNCAFVAFPSKTEGIPLVLIDAAMFSKPALTIRDWIGCSDVVSPGCFAQGLRKLMSDAEYRRDRGMAAKAHCCDRFSRRRILDEWEELLKSVAGQGRPI